MDKIINFRSLILIVFILVFLRMFFIGYDTIYFDVIFVSISLVLIVIFSFSEKEEKNVKRISLILFIMVITVSIYVSANSYRQKVTCENYTDYECVAKMALKLQNAEICDLAEEIGRDGKARSDAGLCYRELSRWWEDVNICEKVKIGDPDYFSKHYDCVVNIAENTNNSSLCEKIDYGEKNYRSKRDCYARFNN